MPSECGKSDLAQQRDRAAAVPLPRPLAVADGERGPLADAVGGQDRGALASAR